MPKIWDRGVYGLVYHGREVDLTSKVDYVTSATRIIIFRKSGGVLDNLDVLRQHGFERLEEWLVTEETEAETAERLQALSKEDDTVVFLTSRKQMRRWQKELVRLGIRWQLLQLVVAFFDGMLPLYRQVYDLLEDEMSRRTFTDVLSIKFKLMPEWALADVFCNDQYFVIPETLKSLPGGTFVDCGAYVGDTVEAFLHHQASWSYDKIVAFEPSSDQYAAMQKRFVRLQEEWALPDGRLIPVNAGVGRKTSRSFLVHGVESDGLSAMRIAENPEAADGGDAVEIVSLDEFFDDQRVDFIKADIEGYEMEMLRGAEHLIRKRHPRLAICIYHKLVDFFEIPLYLKELVPEYHFKVRHHSMDLMETVLYAYCK